VRPQPIIPENRIANLLFLFVFSMPFPQSLGVENGGFLQLSRSGGSVIDWPSESGSVRIKKYPDSLLFYRRLKEISEKGHIFY
jgi:hypothetical protein